jgi:hypothetical protein
VKRTLVVTGLLATGLSVHGLSPATATTEPPDDTQVLTGTVSTVVRETPPGQRPEPVGQRDQVLVTDEGVLDLTDDSEVPDSGRVTVEVVPAGDEVRVTEVVARPGSSFRREAAGAAFVGVRQVYVAIVSPAGMSLADNDSTATSVSALVGKASSYWSSQTRGQVSFEVAQTLPEYVSGHSCEDPYEMWEEALDKFGVDAEGNPIALGPGKHLLVVGPTDPFGSNGCAYGLGTLGSLDADGNAVFVSDDNQSLYAHELGHNLGLDHSNALRCSGTQDGRWNGSTFGSACRPRPYDDLFDVMGFSGPTFGEGNLNVAHLDDLGLQDDVLRTITGRTTQTVKVAPLSSTSTETRGLRVVDAQGRSYFVEYRTDSGRDRVARLNPGRPQLGVRVMQEDPQAHANHGSYVLDATPTTAASDYQRAVPRYGVLRTASRLTTVQVLRQDSTGATVRVVNTTSALNPTRAAMSAPGRVRKWRYATFATRVRDRAGTYSPNQKVYLQRKNSRNRWVTVRSRVTSASGYAKTTYRMTTAGRFRWVVGGTRVVSTTKVVRVRR